MGTFWICSSIGAWRLKWMGNPGEDNRDDFKFVVGGTLTLLGLIIGFTFSMAVERDNQRKDLEQQEANAIGAEYELADLLPPTGTAEVRPLLNSDPAHRLCSV